MSVKDKILLYADRYQEEDEESEESETVDETWDFDPVGLTWFILISMRMTEWYRKFTLSRLTWLHFSVFSIPQLAMITHINYIISIVINDCICWIIGASRAWYQWLHTNIYWSSCSLLSICSACYCWSSLLLLVQHATAGTSLLLLVQLAIAGQVLIGNLIRIDAIIWLLTSTFQVQQK